MTGVKIEKWNDQGFLLSHPDLPKNIWVDFYQLPLDKIQLEYGIIKNPITFVEQIMHGGSMVLVRADTLDYMEMLHDKKDKDEAKTYGVRQLTPGDRVISAICKHGNVMVYLGTFNIATVSHKYRYGYGYSTKNQYFPYIDETPERAFFAYEEPNDKYSIKSYPVQNKVVKENYLASDKGRGNRLDPRFMNEADNMQMILDLKLSTSSSSYKYSDEQRKSEALKKFPNMTYSSWDSTAFIQKGKTAIRENAVNFIKENGITGMRNEHVYATEEEAQIGYSKSR
jgi:hypothetical protein